jgi:aspartyl-tRNA(Asn)/glutamyl-tRNA(Gln) amidotransferase subunit A
VLSSGYYDAYYLRGAEGAHADPARFRAGVRACDALLAPVTPTPAFRVGEKTDDPLQMYLGDIFTVTANLAGICGLSVPCGFTAAGLPVGPAGPGPGLRRGARAARRRTRTSRRRPGRRRGTAGRPTHDGR